MGIDVRPATSDDIDGIRRVAEAAWHEAHAPIVGAETVESFLEQYYHADSFEGYLDDGPALLAVAEDAESMVIGFVSAQPDDDASDTFQLGRIYVTPDRWGEGVGRRLLAHAEAEIADRGGRRIALGVMAGNDRAVDFYEAAGYDRTDAFYDDRIDTSGYTYEKAL